MSGWLIGLGCVRCLIINFDLYLAFTCFFTAEMFMTAYQQSLRIVGSHEQAIRFAIEVFHVRRTI